MVVIYPPSLEDEAPDVSHPDAGCEPPSVLCVGRGPGKEELDAEVRKPDAAGSMF